MIPLDHAHESLEKAIRGTLKINPGLEAVERRKEYSHIITSFDRGLKRQIYDLLDSDVWKAIDAAIGKMAKDQSRIYSESDELEVEDAVINHLKPLSDESHKVSDAFADFLILVFDLGGQDFLNKHNIPATFKLEDENIITNITEKAGRTITGVDQTTAKWIKDQIFSGRESGLSNSDISAKIRNKVPDFTEGRADRIVRTETSIMVGASENTTATKNGASHKYWVTVGGACPICVTNEEAGTIGIDLAFPSGDMIEPAHPNCRCIVEYQFTPFMGSIWHGQ